MLLILGLKVTFKGDLLAGIFGGCVNEAKFWSDDQIKLANIDRQALESCLPPSDHFSEEGYRSFIKKIISKNFKLAERELVGASKEAPPGVCFYVFLKVAKECCSKCPKLLSEALPMTYY